MEHTVLLSGIRKQHIVHICHRCRCTMPSTDIHETTCRDCREKSEWEDRAIKRLAGFDNRPAERNLVMDAGYIISLCLIGIIGESILLWQALNDDAFTMEE